MGFLLDTCVLIWLLRDEKKLSGLAKDLFFDPDNTIYLSHISAWEIALKSKKDKLDLKQNPEQRIRKECERRDITLLAPEFEDYFASVQLPVLHNDPFDRLLVAQAVRRKLILISPDKHIKKYNVKQAW